MLAGNVALTPHKAAPQTQCSKVLALHSLWWRKRTEQRTRDSTRNATARTNVTVGRRRRRRLRADRSDGGATNLNHRATLFLSLTSRGRVPFAHLCCVCVSLVASRAALRQRQTMLSLPHRSCACSNRCSSHHARQFITPANRCEPNELRRCSREPSRNAKHQTNICPTRQPIGALTCPTFGLIRFARRLRKCSNNNNTHSIEHQKTFESSWLQWSFGRQSVRHAADDHLRAPRAQSLHILTPFSCLSTRRRRRRARRPPLSLSLVLVHCARARYVRNHVCIQLASIHSCQLVSCAALGPLANQRALSA